MSSNRWRKRSQAQRRPGRRHDDDGSVQDKSDMLMMAGLPEAKVDDGDDLADWMIGTGPSD